MPTSGDVLLDSSSENDSRIAALALEYPLPLAARDAHFDRIAGLQVLKWRESSPAASVREHPG